MNDDLNLNNEITLDKDNTATIKLSSSNNAQEILDSISNGKNVELDIDKETLLSNFNTFLLAEAYSQLETIIKLHKLQVKCLDKYYEQVNELIDNDDANTFMLEKIITTINDSIDRCNNIIFKLGLNSNVTDQLLIKNIDKSQNVNIFQSQISKQKVLDTLNLILNYCETEN